VTRNACLLVSVQPRYALAILSGEKKYEIRRRAVRAPIGTRVVLYATHPTKALVGTARIKAKLFLDSRAAWDTHADDLGIDRRSFDSYVKGTTKVCLVELDRVVPLQRTITLAALTAHSKFRPPQSYRYVSDEDPTALQMVVPG